MTPDLHRDYFEVTLAVNFNCQPFTAALKFFCPV